MCSQDKWEWTGTPSPATTVLDNSNLQFKFQLPTSDSTQISAGGPKVPIEGFVPLDAP